MKKCIDSNGLFIKDTYNFIDIENMKRKEALVHLKGRDPFGI
ncbi:MULTISPECIES: hypothetical protein [Bacillus cereus group]|nr:hypothetical protein bcere0029_59960 [Bacillus cereus AH1272]